jgi:thiol-disulfide isomerase/thioredoxin
MALAALVLVAVVFGLYVAMSVKSPVAVVQEAPALPKLSVTFIDPTCAVCANLSVVSAGLKSAFNVTSERTLDAESLEAGSLIEQYDISKLPAVLLEGDIEKLELPGFVKQGPVLVSREVPPPFVDASSMEVRGEVEATVLSATSCVECHDLSPVLTQLKQLGVVFAKERVVDVSSEEGKALVSEFNISRVPTVLFSSEAQWYAQITEPFKTVGTVEADGSFVWRQVNAPYVELPSGKLRGKLELVYLNDSSCVECYPVTLHKDILSQNFGAFIASEKTVDVSSAEGKTLVSQYNVSKVPTVLVKGDVAAYPVLVGAWADVGSVVDGVYVFRELDVLQQPYRDVVKGTVVKPQKAP